MSRTRNIDLLNGSILPTLLKLSGPLVATYFAHMAYNFIDIIFVGRLGTGAVAALGTSGNIMWFSNTLAMLPSIGLSIRVAQSYGRGDIDQSKKSLRDGIKLALFLGVFLGLFINIFIGPIVGFYNLEADVALMTSQYLSIIGVGFLFTFTSQAISSTYNSLGNSATPFRINVIGLIANIILDPVLIFGLGPFPFLGIRGAAIATVSSQLLVLILYVVYIFREGGIVYNSGFTNKIDFEEIKTITQLGTPTFLKTGVQAIVAMVLNKYMAAFGSAPVAVYSVGSQIESLSWGTTNGLGQAITAFAGQNYGSENYDRVRKSTRYGIISASIIGVAVMGIFIAFGEEIFSIFLPDDSISIGYGVIYLQILSLSQILMNIDIICTGAFNAIGKPNIPGLVGVVGNLLRIPLSILLIKPLGVLGIWWSVTISSNLKGLILLVLLYMQDIFKYRDFKQL